MCLVKVIDSFHSHLFYSFYIRGSSLVEVCEVFHSVFLWFSEEFVCSYMYIYIYNLMRYINLNAFKKKESIVDYFFSFFSYDSLM